MSIPVSRRLEFSEIPLIDIEPFILQQATHTDIKRLAKSCSEVGFFYIHNHGIDPDLVQKILEQARIFFSLPLQLKNKIKIDERIRGYLPLGYSSYKGETREGTSRQQGFWMGQETAVDPIRKLDGPNQWPEELPELKQVMTQYWDSIEQLSHVLLHAFALSLGLAEDYFEACFQRPTSRLKLNHYPPQENPTDENHIGVVPHSDSGAFTILWQDQLGGLEIQNSTGEWVVAPPVDNSFVVNIGNIMQYWSNGRYSSTPHRVINRSGQARYSIPMFVNPDHEVVIKALVDQHKLHFEPFLYGNYQLDLWRKTFPVAQID